MTPSAEPFVIPRVVHRAHVDPSALRSLGRASDGLLGSSTASGSCRRSWPSTPSSCPLHSRAWTRRSNVYRRLAWVYPFGPEPRRRGRPRRLRRAARAQRQGPTLARQGRRTHARDVMTRTEARVPACPLRSDSEVTSSPRNVCFPPRGCVRTWLRRRSGRSAPGLVSVSASGIAGPFRHSLPLEADTLRAQVTSAFVPRASQ